MIPTIVDLTKRHPRTIFKYRFEFGILQISRKIPKVCMRARSETNCRVDQRIKQFVIQFARTQRLPQILALSMVSISSTAFALSVFATSSAPDAFSIHLKRFLQKSHLVFE